MSDPCPVCERNNHTNHSIWLMSDDPEIDEAVRKAREYPQVTLTSVEGDVTGRATPRGRVIQVVPGGDEKVERDYRDFEVVIGWESDTHYGESVEYPVYTTLYEDVKTGILLTDKDAFEKWITR